MPPLKHTHLQLLTDCLFIMEFVNFVSHKPTRKPKIAKEYAFSQRTEKDRQ